MSYKCLINGERTEITARIVKDALVPAPEYCPRSDNTTTTTKTITQRIATHKAPRLFNQLQQGVDGVDNYDRSHLWDVVCLDASVITTLPDYLGESGSIRRANNNTVIVFYWSTADWNFFPGSALETIFNNGVQADWIARDTNGNPVKLFTAPPVEGYSPFWTFLRNITNEGLQDYFVNFINEYIMPYSDGVFYDWATTNVAFLNHYTNPSRTTSEMDLNGDSEGDTDEEINEAWISGWTEMATKSIDAYPSGSIIMGNAGWATGNDYAPYINGIMMEQFMRAPIENPGNYSWSQQLLNYSYYCNNALSPKVSAIQAAGDQDDYQFMRFTLTSALMFDGYYSYTNKDVPTIAYQVTWWYDEYSVNITSGNASESLSNKGWLGNPLGDAFNVDNEEDLLYDNLLTETTIAETKVWRRNYQNGIVICNPTTDPVTVDLGGTFRKINGSIDTTFNDGSTITSIDLDTLDGAVLLYG